MTDDGGAAAGHPGDIVEGDEGGDADLGIVAVAAGAMLVGEELTPAAIEAAADKASRDERDPLGDIHATPEFKRHLARVLTGRALRTAAERARQGRTS